MGGGEALKAATYRIAGGLFLCHRTYLLPPMKYHNLTGLLLLVFSALNFATDKPATESTVVAQVVVIHISENGDYQLNGEEMSISELSLALQHAGLSARMYAVVKVAPDTPMGLYSDFLKELRGMNLAGVSYEPLNEANGVAFYQL